MTDFLAINSEAFSPDYIYDIIRHKYQKILQSQKGRQEDAEEFLGYLLDGLHEELAAGLLLCVMNIFFSSEKRGFFTKYPKWFTFVTFLDGGWSQKQTIIHTDCMNYFT
jgi:hypothetical protein